MRMRKCRWVHMALLALCALSPVSSWALGLGEIDVESALNERFVGKIPVVDGEGYSKAEIVVSLASREDFDRVGVERFFYLTNLKFDVEIDAGGAATVNVSSSQPVSEPYLNFIVEVLWPQGRLLKEFTVLLDPPTYSEVAAAPQISAPTQSVARETSRPSTSTAAQQGTRVRVPPSSAPSARREPWDTRDGVMTTRDDTLWKIASRTLPSERVTVHQQMLALQRKNPEAFMRDNVNLLKAGYVLELPTESEALATSNDVAVADVAQQTQAWRDGTLLDAAPVRQAVAQDTQNAQPQMGSQVDATAGRAGSGSAAGDGTGEVRILASTGDVASGTASGDDASVNQLIEEKETLARQVDELNYQLDREKEIAANQVTVKDRQLEVKDQEIAQLQERLRQQQQAMQELQQNQDQSAPATAPETPWWMSPFVLIGVIAALVLVLVFALLGMRRARAEAQAYADMPLEYESEPVVGTDTSTYMEVDEASPIEDEPEDDAAGLAAAGLTTAALAEDEADDDDDLSQLYAEDQAEESADESAEDGGQTGDVIGEAEIYIAYGRYGQAVNLLTNFLEQEPERNDVRLKLLEVYVESHDRVSFDEQAQYFADNCEDPDVLQAVQELESQMRESQLDLTTGEPADAEAGVESPQLDDDFELDLDADPGIDAEGIDADTGAQADATGEAAAGDSDNEESADEFELEFDTDSVDEVVEGGASAALGGDLGMDFDPDRDVDESLNEQGIAPLEELADLDSLEDVDTIDEIEVELDSDGAAQSAVPELDEDLLDLDDLDDLGLAEDAPQAPAADVAAVDQQSSDDESFEDDFDFGTGADADINATKLDLAEAYIDMGDADGATDILREVLDEGTDEQRKRAQELLDGIA